MQVRQFFTTRLKIQPKLLDRNNNMGVTHNFDIDPRISPKQFMELLGCKTTCFYGKIKKGEIKKPYYDGSKITYWHASYVKEIVEKNKCS
ncbi:hypothetical protein [Acinetobacter ursingii]|uniref:hypothetical protein n=1 Tax=Acinetobacter ursingii TaxID=108980 RepID=UPI001D18711C|nr:hypothetical protein [Acinetobacter ursingii]